MLHALNFPVTNTTLLNKITPDIEISIQIWQSKLIYNATIVAQINVLIKPKYLVKSILHKHEKEAVHNTKKNGIGVKYDGKSSAHTHKTNLIYNLLQTTDRVRKDFFFFNYDNIFVDKMSKK